MPMPPLLVFDNVFDRMALYPGALVTVSNESRAGYEARRAFDYRRDRTAWYPVGDGSGGLGIGNYMAVDLGSTRTAAPTVLWLDRGHNWWTRQVQVQSSADGTSYATVRTLTLPAATVVGGDPTTTTMAVTEEGACWAMWTAPTARRYWRVVFSLASSVEVLLPGLILGAGVVLPTFSKTLDEDGGQRTQATEESTYGYRANVLSASWRSFELTLTSLGTADYDTTLRALRRPLFELNQPGFVCMDYQTRPERGWLMQVDQANWSMPTERVHRTGRVRLREVGHKVPL